MVAPENHPAEKQNGRPTATRRRVTNGGLLLGRPFGVPIYISASWLVFVAFITVQFAPVVASAVPGIGAARFVVAAQTEA